MLYWKILYCWCYDGSVHAVLEKSCSFWIGRYCTVGAMMELFMQCWNILYCRCYGGSVHAMLEDTVQ